MKDIFNEIRAEELTEDLQDLSELIGIESVRKLLKFYAGAQFYIPKITRLDSFIFNYLNKNRSKGTKALANELSCSEQYVRNKRKALQEMIKSL